MKKRSGYTILEVMIVVLVLSIVSLGIFALYNQFYEIKEEVETKAKLKTFKEVIYNSMFEIDKVKQLLASSPLDDAGNVPVHNPIQYFDDTNTLVDILIPNSFEPLDIIDTTGVITSKGKALEKFFNVSFQNDLLFYSNVYYYYTVETEKLFGFIDINYKKFSFIHVNDAKFSNALKNAIKNADTAFISQIFDDTQDYIVINRDINDTSAIRIGYIIDNWPIIRKKINVVQFTTRDHIIEPLTYLKKQLEEGQKKINDWATIQARFEAHKSVSTGNTLNVDYFITCKANLTNNECLNDTEEIKTTQTLLKLDDGTANANENRVKLIDLADADARQNASNDYGFIVLDKASNNLNKSTTNGCVGEITDTKHNLQFTFDNALTLTPTNLLDTSDCKTSKTMSAMIDDANPFGYSIFFSNGETSAFTSPIVKEVGLNRYPKLDVGAPYNASLFTVLPNNAVIVKKLYGHIF